MRKRNTVFFLFTLFITFFVIMLSQGILDKDISYFYSDPIQEYKILTRNTATSILPLKQELLLYSDNRRLHDEALSIIKNHSGKADPSKPMVALTYDDGPFTPVTDRILDIMEKYDSHCTFFVVGNRIGSFPSSVKRAASLGCELGSHSFDHSSFLSLSEEEIFEQINETDYLIWYYTEKKTTLLRPPSGSHDKRTDSIAGKPIIMWSLDTQDWYTRDSKLIAKKILATVKDGDIILMHDLYDSSAEATEIVVPELITRGYQLVTVSEMAHAKGVSLEIGKTYFHM